MQPSTPTRVSSRTSALPAETHSQLVDTLFSTVGSFLAGIVGASIVPIVAYARTQSPVFLASGGVLAVLALFRITVYLGYSHRERLSRPISPRAWERLYGLGAVGFMTAVGVIAALLFHATDDPINRLYAVVIAIGCAGALAARNAARPFIVYGQVFGLCAPIAVVLAFQSQVWFWGLAGMIVLIMVSVKSTTKFLNQVVVSALLNGRDAVQERERLGAALNCMSHGLCMGEASGDLAVLNNRMRTFFDLRDGVSELTLDGLADVIAAQARMKPACASAFTAAWRAQLQKQSAGGFSQQIRDKIYDFRFEPRSRGGFVVVVEDVTETRRAALEIERMAHFDAVTGLPNRVHFHHQLVAALAERRSPHEVLALLSIDLDHFKDVNDTRGHPAGDELLRLVAKRLRSKLKASDIVARFGGDEFQVLVRGASSVAEVQEIADRLIRTISANFLLRDSLVAIGASIGIAIAAEEPAEADDLLRWADMALYRAKADGRGLSRTFSPDMDEAMQHKREMENMLREAIAEGYFELHYQPVVDIRSGAVVACEALVRMRHPVKGMVSPGEFIPAAEETGLIVEIGDWVLRQACADAATWPRGIRVAVNFSPKQFILRPNIASMIADALQASGLQPGRLEVEITESTLMEAKDAIRELEQISGMGVKIALDDFGTGYSSLSYLRQFPVDKIKIDRSFAQDVLSRASKAVIGSVSVLAQMLDVDLVVEGVETADQLDALRHWDVRLVQGYIFSRPVPLDQLALQLQAATPFRKQVSVVRAA